MTDRTAAADCPDAFVEFAGWLADASGPILRRYFRTPLAVEFKDNDSPVAVVDREAEAAMRAIIEAEYPDHGILGEELGRERTDAEYVWVLDPLDGTQCYITGKPTFGTLVSLVHRGVPVIGILDQPFLDERWLGVAGRPTLFNGQPVQSRACAGLDKAWLYATSPHIFPEADFTAFERVRKSARRTVYGAECYAYGLLAIGLVDLIVESTMQPYDYCALVPLVEGAGGVITDWQGKALGLESDGRVLAAGDARMQAAAVALLG